MTDASQTSRARTSPWPRRIGLLLIAYATIALAISVMPPLPTWLDTLRYWLSVVVFPLPDSSFAWSLATGLLGTAVAARKRLGWGILLGLCVLTAALDALIAIAESDWLFGTGAVVSAAYVIGLVAVRRAFFAKVRRGALFVSLGALVLGLALVVGIGMALVTWLPNDLPASDRLPWVLFAASGFGESVPDIFEAHAPPGLGTTLSLLSAAVLLLATVLLFRSQHARHAIGQGDERILRTLVSRFGEQDSLAYFSTRRDKSVVYSQDGRAAVTYRVEMGVCLAGGDPLGDPASRGKAVEAWLDTASEHGWVPAVMGASRQGAEAYAAAGLSVLHLGDEAIVDTDRLALDGAGAKALRHAVARARRGGATVRIRRQHEIDPLHLRRLAGFASDHRGTEAERGFSMALGRVGSDQDPDILVVEALVSDQVVGLLTLVPWGRRGVSLDVMRRSADAPNGVNELMVSELCEYGREHGVERVSLNFAVFREVFEEGADLGAGPVLRLWRSVLLFFSRWWQLESLYRSNAKYEPRWVPRFLCFADTRTLAQVGAASAIAEGFLHLPFDRPRAGYLSPPPLSPGGHRALSFAEQLDREPALHGPPPAPRPEQVRVRMDKAARLIESGEEPWPLASPPTHTTSQALTAPEGTSVSVAGRILALRDLGGVVFADVSDWQDRVQLLLEAGPVQDGFTRAVDLGDLVGVRGRIGTSRSGETSVLVEDWWLNAKSLHPLPDKRHGLRDEETRVRERHLDLAIRPEARQVLEARVRAVRALRDGLANRGYLEVETPILQQVHGGANARPFQTRINAYSMDLYLRIAPELYLKRLCVGGMEKVFELGRTFRNEGVDATHNPEFTILEAYEAHADYQVMMDLCRQLVQEAAVAVHGECVAVAPDGTKVDISGEWPVITLHDAVSDQLVARGLDPISTGSSQDELRQRCAALDIAVQPQWDAGHLALELYEHLVERSTTRPTFYTNFPLSVSPLTRTHRTDPGVTERWDLVAWGVELGTAYSELTDPLEQRRRLTAQSLLAAGGDPEAMEVDEDFLRALELGMPPTGGLGIGVDRVVMLLTGLSIRETLAFPLARPRS